MFYQYQTSYLSLYICMNTTWLNRIQSLQLPEPNFAGVVEITRLYFTELDVSTQYIAQTRHADLG